MALYWAILIGLAIAVLSAPRERRQAVDPLCSANPTGVNAINCTSFVHCHDGVVMGIQTCGSEPGQLKFNPDIGQCDWAQNVNCDAPKLGGDEICSQIPPGFEQLSYYAPDPTYCNMYFVCSNGNYVGTRNCGWNQIFDEFSRNCTFGGVDSCTKPMLPFENLH